MEEFEDIRIIHGADGASYAYALDERGEACIVHCTSLERDIDIPEFLDGHRVVRLGPSSFAGLAHAASIACPQTVRSIGAGAFRDCPNLMRLVFPDELDDFDLSWVRGCKRLRDIAFPGAAREVPAGLFELGDVRVLRLGANTRSVAVPRSHAIELDELHVSADNRWLSVRGPALYSAAGVADSADAPSDDSKVGVDVGPKLIVLFKPCARYRVADGCASIGPYAFAHHHELEQVDLPASVRQVGEGAFANTPLLSSTSLPPAACGDPQQTLASVADRPWEVAARYDSALFEVPDERVRARLMMQRLANPLFMGDSSRKALMGKLRDDLAWLCVELADENDLAAFDLLVDVDVVDAAALVGAIERLSPRRHGEAIAHLLALKQARFGDARPDFDI